MRARRKRARLNGVVSAFRRVRLRRAFLEWGTRNRKRWVEGGGGVASNFVREGVGFAQVVFFGVMRGAMVMV